MVIKVLKPATFTINQLVLWKEHLEKYGFVVLEEIISENNAEKAINMFKKEFNSVSPSFDWEDKKTWICKNAPIVWNKGSVVFNGFGQSNTIWFLRLHTLVKNAFAEVYDTTELATSFDGLALNVSESQKSTSWLHQDQRESDKRKSIQGILNLLPCNVKDAGFICVPKSHTEYSAPDQNTDWVMLPKDSEYQTKAVKLITPARSLILFNSKLIHANQGMSKKHPKKVHLNRLSAYITFVPKSRQSEEVRKQRISGYLNKHTTSHWADRHEPKKIPFHIQSKFKNSGFNDLEPLLNENKDIPEDRLDII